MDKWEYQNKPCYLENSNVKEPCKRKTACIFFAQRSKLEERHYQTIFLVTHKTKDKIYHNSGTYHSITGNKS